MKLAAQQKGAFIEHLKRKLVGPCPICEGYQWETRDDVYFSDEARPGAESSQQTPQNPGLVTAACSNCGYIAWFSMAIVGIDQSAGLGAQEERSPDSY